ncbi:neurotransmitter:Na+ symporter, NSS family [Oceanobacillus limi]|uniref:Neurotransmitter:Na+ symporter, NSS family n=1 Tax=Oceanobacillus limi TaxID=930131 RepID=A0A1I0E661_9BACI|nr:sodium-dependent transporter [Oceanobacillus limi]SET40297.1 neurotransmitter:Na+ symporter, NSS family [Oceanobacillus limi]
MAQQEQWKSKIGFILATAGSAIGLGAIWKFPYVAGTGGGGAFFFLFITFTLVLGMPLLMGEFLIGRKGQTNPIDTYRKLASNPKWGFIGKMGVFTSFILLSFYSVVGGWIILYIVKIVTGGLSVQNDEQYMHLFEDIISNPFSTVIAQFTFMLIAILVVSQGIQKGIEVASKIMMPALLILFIGLVIRSLSLDGAMEGVKFLLVPDFSKLTSESILFALGQSFFTLSLGVSVMVTYASYLPKTQNIPKSAISIILLNTIIALMAGLAIFPGVFAFELEPNAGPVLIFAVLPAVFNHMPFGMVLFLAFLILFLFAALTSAFSMVEIIVASVTKSDATKRKKYTWLTGILIFIVGIPSCLSYGVLSDVKFFNKTVFDLMDFTVSNILMPLGALLIAVFVSRFVSKDVLYSELKQGSNIGNIFFSIWFVLLKYVTPIAIIIVFLDVVGLFKWIVNVFN